MAVKLFYFKEEVGNFGDDLNPWLWPKILPDVLDDDTSELFVGIGTLLNHRLPQQVSKHIFGSGYGYGKLPTVDDSWKVICLRGPLTAKSLSLDPDLAVTDSALLLRNIYQPQPTVDGPIGFIPHYHSVRLADWDKLAEEAGLLYISPEWPVEEVLHKIRGCRAILCEAMHGAIAADALRVPWKAIQLNLDLFELKWKDWLETVQLPFVPNLVPEVYRVRGESSFFTRRRDDIKRLAMHLPFANVTPPPRRDSGESTRRAAVAELVRLSQTPGFQLSRDEVQGALLNKLNDLLARFRQMHVG